MCARARGGMVAGMSATSPFPKLTRKQRSALNQLLWAKRILREAPVERLRLAERIEQITREHGLPERGQTSSADDLHMSDAAVTAMGLGRDQQHWAASLGLPPRGESRNVPTDEDEECS